MTVHRVSRRMVLIVGFWVMVTHQLMTKKI